MNILKKNQKNSKISRFYVSKKLFSIALVTLLTVSTFAQKQQRKQHKPDLSPEQIAEVQTKEMTLQLELNEKQQKQILKINKKMAIERKQQMKGHRALREKSEKLTSEELIKRKSARLDKQIAHQKEMKKILNEKQFETWKESRNKKAGKMKKRMGKKKMGKRSKMQQKK